MSATKSLKDLYLHEIKDIYSANKQAAEATGMFARKLDQKDTVEKLEKAVEGIKSNNEHLATIAEAHGKKASGVHCKGMEGLCEEAKKHVLHSDYATDDLRAAAAISQFQRITHYALAGYGTAHAYAKELGDKQGMKTLKTLLDDAYEGDRAFTDLATETVNPHAAKAGGEEEE